MNTSPLDIIRKISDAPILQKDDIVKSYINSEISDWLGKIEDITKVSGDFVKVSLFTEYGLDNVKISFEANLSECPGLKTAKRGQKVLIKKGKIKEEISGHRISLYDCQISFDLKDDKTGKVLETQEEKNWREEGERKWRNFKIVGFIIIVVIIILIITK